ncbi:MAG: lamin tail domain-containing protein [Anaerolineales bacterium]|nr:lamin tail domain-containing protein [Anaerolineales bacterium]
MENENLRLTVIFTVFGVLGLLGFCIGMILLWSLLNLTSTPAPTETLMGTAAASTPPQTVSATLAMSSTLTSTPSPTGSITTTVETSATLSISPSATGAQSLETPELTSSPVLTTTAAPSSTPGVVLSDAWCVPWNTQAIRARVLRALDGVSFEASAGGELLQVRYIGIDVPEPTNGIDTQAAAFEKNKQLVEGKEVLLIQDKSQATDQEGLLPRYVIVGGIFANLEMIQSGYAVARSAAPDIRCDDLFQRAEELAQAGANGVWALTPTPTRTRPAPTETLSRTGYVIISYIFFKGEKWAEPNEFVEIHNLSDNPVQLKNWTVKNLENHVYVFPEYILLPGQFCRVYTNQYHSGTCGFTFNNPAPIWDDLSDCAYLKDSLGVLVDEYCYE